jgi:predicted GNAT family acetyltransferase
MEPVMDQQDQGRFAVFVDGHVGELVYRLDGDRMILVHTGVPKQLGGRGIGGQLIRAAIDRAAREGLTIVPMCPFAERWIKDHPDEAAGVAVDWDGWSG